MPLALGPVMVGPPGELAVLLWLVLVAVAVLRVLLFLIPKGGTRFPKPALILQAAVWASVPASAFSSLLLLGIGEHWQAYDQLQADLEFLLVPLDLSAVAGIYLGCLLVLYARLSARREPGLAMSEAESDQGHQPRPKS